MAFEHDAGRLRVVAAEFLQPQAELEARPLPRQPADLAAEDLCRQLLAVLGGGDRDDRVGMHVVDMLPRHEGVQRRVDRGRARVEVERAVGEVAHHLVLVLDAAIELLQAFELRLVERGEAVELDGADVAARALHPQHLDRLAGERILLHHLGRGVAAAVVGDALVGAEQVGAVEQPLRLAHSGCLGVVPKVGEARIGARFEHRTSSRTARPARRGDFGKFTWLDRRCQSKTINFDHTALHNGNILIEVD